MSVSFVQPSISPNDTTVTKVRSLVVSNTGLVASAVACNLYSWSITNGNSAVIYVKFYDKATAATAADVPEMTLAVQATSTSIIRGWDMPESFSAGLSVRAVTVFADNGTTNPATLPIVELEVCAIKTGN